MSTPYRDIGGPRLPCPRCDRELLARRVGGVPVEECSAGCHGLFVGADAIRQIIEQHADGYADALLEQLPRREIRVMPHAGERMYIQCPHCRQIMNRRQFATGAGVVVDVCKPHGTFFDCGELPAVIEFVMAGGLEKAATKDAQHKRDVEREHRDHARHAAALAAQAPARPFIRIEGYTHGDALVDLLSALIGS